MAKEIKKLVVQKGNAALELTAREWCELSSALDRLKDEDGNDQGWRYDTNHVIEPGFTMTMDENPGILTVTL